MQRQPTLVERRGADGVATDSGAALEQRGWLHHQDGAASRDHGADLALGVEHVADGGYRTRVRLPQTCGRRHGSRRGGGVIKAPMHFATDAGPTRETTAFETGIDGAHDAVLVSHLV